MYLIYVGKINNFKLTNVFLNYVAIEFYFKLLF